MTDPKQFEARLAAVESRVEQLAADTAVAVSGAAAARHLAAARDRDLVDLTIKIDASRQAINGLGVQTAGRFDRLEQRFDRLEQRSDRLEQRVDQLEQKADAGFIEMRGRFDQTAAGMARIVELLTARDGG